MPEQKIVIGEKFLTREELFKEDDDFRKERAKLSLEEKIRILVELQKLAQSFGKKKGSDYIEDVNKYEIKSK